MTEKRNWLSDKVETIKKRSKTDKKYKKRMLIVWAILLAIWTGLSYFVAQLIVFAIARIALEHGWNANINVAQTICMVISYVLAFLIMIWLPKKLFGMKVTRDSLGLKGWPTWTDILLSPVGYVLSLVAAVAVILLVSIFVPTINWEQTQDVGFNAVFTNTDRIIVFVALVVFAPITEELVFRGFLYGKLRSRLSAVPAIIIVSVLFGLMHGQWNVGIIVGVMSVLMCIARELTGTIYAGILMHMIRNGIAFYLLYVNPISIPGAASAVLPILLPFLV